MIDETHFNWQNKNTGAPLGKIARRRSTDIPGVADTVSSRTPYANLPFIVDCGPWLLRAAGVFPSRLGVMSLGYFLLPICSSPQIRAKSWIPFWGGRVGQGCTAWFDVTLHDFPGLRRNGPDWMLARRLFHFEIGRAPRLSNPGIALSSGPP